MHSETVPIRPERICRELTRILPPDAVLVSDTGHSSIWTGTMVELSHPTQRYLRCAGSLGWALPGAIGAKCALPDRPVVAFLGDGGFYYHMSELETAARCGINVVFVVNNNHALNQEQNLLKAAYRNNVRGRSAEMWEFTPRNYADVARDLGCEGIRVEHPKDIRPVLENALSAKRPVLIDVATDINAMAPRSDR
jgi:acetolactate synthase-1/2/3 large subunit